MVRRAYIKLIAAMLIWGSLGVFVKNIPLESSQIALGRITLGLLFLGAVFLIKGNKSTKESVKKALLPLIISGAFMGFNWVCLFEAYRYTTVSMSTIAYYFAPIIVMIVSPFLLKEKATLSKIIGIIAAMVGLYLISGNMSGGTDPLKGFIYGLGAAALYASVTLINKKVSGISGMEITIIQLMAAVAVILPYSIFTNESGWSLTGFTAISSLVIIGVVHTGIALYMYFSAVQVLPGQSVALCSYMDPASALVFSAVLIGERLEILQIVGGLLILGGALFGEIGGRSFKKGKKD